MVHGRWRSRGRLELVAFDGQRYIPFALFLEHSPSPTPAKPLGRTSPLWDRSPSKYLQGLLGATVRTIYGSSAYPSAPLTEPCQRSGIGKSVLVVDDSSSTWNEAHSLAARPLDNLRQFNFTIKLYNTPEVAVRCDRNHSLCLNKNSYRTKVDDLPQPSLEASPSCASLRPVIRTENSQAAQRWRRGMREQAVCVLTPSLRQSCAACLFACPAPESPRVAP
jgi:hypothetical protein